MKKSKILAFLTAFTMISALFVTFSVTANAAANPTNDGLKFVAEYAGLDADDYYVFNFKLEDPESKLQAVTGSKKYTGNALDQIQFVINFDEEIFDVSELYVTKTSAIAGGLTTTSKDAELPVKYAWIQSDYTALVSTLPSDYIVSVAVLTNGTYTEKEMLAGISFDGLCNYRIQYFDGTSKEPTYTTSYRVDGLGDYVPATIVGSESEPDPDPTPSVTEAVAGKTIENGYKTFSAPAPVTMPSSINGEIAVTKTNSERKLTHALPDGVAGGKAKVLPIVSYKIGEKGVNAADVFTITITSGSDTIATYTYTVPSAE